MPVNPSMLEMVMKGKVVAEVSIIPVGTGDTGLSHHIAACLEVLEGRKDISYRLTSMGTIIEGPLDKVLEVIHKMHEVPFSKGASRVVTSLKIDDRRDKLSTMAGKIESVVKLRPSIKA
jgi:uncharacterized protein (TIGR00106 family)